MASLDIMKNDLYMFKFLEVNAFTTETGFETNFDIEMFEFPWHVHLKNIYTMKHCYRLSQTNA
jgi:hypothetical protein